MRGGRGDDRGSAAVELAVLCPVLGLLAGLALHIALWMHAQHVADAAAQQGARALTIAGGTEQGAQRHARTALRRLGPDLLSGVQVSARRDAQHGTVTIRGRAVAILPGLTLSVHARATHQLEQFRPDLPDAQPGAP